MAEFADPPRSLIAQSQIANLTRLDERGESGKLFGDGNCFPLLGGVVIRRAKERDVTIGPVNLIEVDLISFQALEAVGHRLGDVGALEAVVAAANPSEPPTGTGNFSSDNQLVSRLPD